MGKNAILFSRIDKEDLWVNNGLVFKVQNIDSYKDAYDEIKETLESPEVIDYVIREMYENEETFKFIGTILIHSKLFITFENQHGSQVEFILSADFITVLN